MDPGSGPRSPVQYRMRSPATPRAYSRTPINDSGKGTGLRHADPRSPSGATHHLPPAGGEDGRGTWPGISELRRPSGAASHLLPEEDGRGGSHESYTSQYEEALFVRSTVRRARSWETCSRRSAQPGDIQSGGGAVGETTAGASCRWNGNLIACYGDGYDNDAR